jgi:thiol-disulfide isomerase/thioredoxin
VDGKRYADISGLSGIDSDTDGRGAAYADLDNDGDVDIFRTAFQRKAHHLFRNNVGQRANFLRVSLIGTKSGTDAFGTVVRVGTSRGVQTRFKSGGAGFVSQHDPRLLFGLGSDTSVEWIEVAWPSGSVEKFRGVGAGLSVLITEGQGRLTTLEDRAFALPDPPADREVLLAKLAVRPGDRFPDLALGTLAGDATTFRAESGSGRATVVNLWATYCVPCRKEMPELERLSAELSRAGVDVIGLSIDVGKGRKKVPGFVRKQRLTYPVYTTTDGVFARIYSGDEVFIPLTYLVGADGIVTEVFTGWSKEAEGAIRKLAQ